MELSRGVCALCPTSKQIIKPSSKKVLEASLKDLMKDSGQLKNLDVRHLNCKICPMCLHDIIAASKHKKKMHKFTPNSKKCSFCYEKEHLIVDADWSFFDKEILDENLGTKGSACTICMYCMKFLDIVSKVKKNILRKYIPHKKIVKPQTKKTLSTKLKLRVILQRVDLLKLKAELSLNPDTKQESTLRTPTKASRKMMPEDNSTSSSGNSSSKKRKSVSFAEHLNCEIPDSPHSNGKSKKPKLKSSLKKLSSNSDSDEDVSDAELTKKKGENDVDNESDEEDASKSYVREIQQNNDFIFESLKNDVVSNSKKSLTVEENVKAEESGKVEESTELVETKRRMSSSLEKLPTENDTCKENIDRIAIDNVVTDGNGVDETTDVAEAITNETQDSEELKLSQETKNSEDPLSSDKDEEGSDFKLSLHIDDSDSNSERTEVMSEQNGVLGKDT